MQDKELIGLIASLWAAGLALPCNLTDTTHAGISTVADVATEAELVAAITNPQIATIILTNDLILLEALQVKCDGEVKINFNGHRIASLAARGAAVQIETGTLTLTGRGSLVSSHAATDAIQVRGALTDGITNYSGLYLDQKVALYAPEGFGVLIVPNLQAAYGVKVKIQGKIVAHDGVGVSAAVQNQGENLPQITLTAGARIEVDNQSGKVLDIAQAAARVVLEAGEYRGPDVADLAKYLDGAFHLKLSSNGCVARVQPKNPPVKSQSLSELTVARTALQKLVQQAATCLDESRIGHELGEWQAPVNKVTGGMRRTLKAAQKLLHGEENATLEQITHLSGRLRTAFQGIDRIADELRAEILSILATAEELEPKDYSIYSYSLLSEAMMAADALVVQEEASLNELYSALCDVRLNLDLLDDPDDESDFVLPKPRLATWNTPAHPPKLKVSEDMVAHDVFLQTQENLQNMLEIVEGLTVADYRPEAAEQFGELQVAIAKARALLQQKDLTLPQIMDAMDEIKFATAGLQTNVTSTSSETVEVDELDWSALRSAVAEIAQLEAGDYTAASYGVVLNHLERAKVLLASTNVTQEAVDDLVFDLNLAVVALSPIQPVPVSQQFAVPAVPKKRKLAFGTRLVAKLFS